MGSYLSRHMQVLFSTLGDMARTPMMSINTLLIIGVTLLLPTLLYISIQTAQSLSGQWQGRPQFSVFLEKDISEGSMQLIFDEIQLHPKIELAELLSPEEALAEFKILANRGGGDIESELAFIGENPLPASIVVMPKKGFANAQHLNSLEEQLSQFDGIESVKLDLAWTDRFNAMLKVFSQVSLLLSGLLSLALVLIVGNTIKLLIYNRRHEIEISKLVGGSNGFIRRPFLYYGSFFGLFGSLITLGFLLIAQLLIAAPMTELAQAYQSKGVLYSLTIIDIITLIAVGTSLGWLSARWAVAQHLRKIKPS